MTPRTSIEDALRDTGEPGEGDDLRARPPRLPVSDVSYIVDDTRVGRVLLAVTAEGAMVASRFAPDTAAEDALLGRLAARVSPRVLRQPRPLDPARRQLQDYLAGDRQDFDLPLDLVLSTPFQQLMARRLLATAAYGQRTTYAALAAGMGRPSAVRAVGAALGANPLCLLVPCHRVVASDGALTGYAGGVAAKRYLLELESRPAGTAGQRPRVPIRLPAENAAAPPDDEVL